MIESINDYSSNICRNRVAMGATWRRSKTSISTSRCWTGSAA